MICPNCWSRSRPDFDSEQFLLKLIDPLPPEDIRKSPMALDYWEGVVIEAEYHHKDASVVIAGRDVQFQHSTPTGVSRVRTRWEFVCPNCAFTWNTIEGDDHLETYKLSPEQKFNLILWPILAFFLATVLCSLVWGYHWKQVKMAENGFEKIEVPVPGTTVTEWRKIKSNPEKGQ